MSRLTQSVSAFIYIVVLMLLPVLVVPFSGVASDLQKGDIAAFALGIACVLAAVVAAVSRRAFALPFSGVLLAGVPLVIAAVASAFTIGNPAQAWWGNAIELGTVGSIVLFACAIVAGGLLPPAPIRLLLNLFIGATTVAGIVAGLAAAFTTHNALFGSWPQLSCALAAALLAAVLQLDWSEQFDVLQLFLLVESIALCVCFFLFYNTAAVLALLPVLFVALCMQTFFFTKRGASRLPVVSFFAILIFLAAVFFGVKNPILQLPLEVRPTPAATEFVGTPVYLLSLCGALLGSGPNTFSEVWDKYRPTELNATALWNTTFGEGYSLTTTFAITFGALGFLALLSYFFICAAWAVRRRGVHGTTDMFAAAAGVASFSFVLGLFYTSGLTLFLLGAAMAGFCLRLLLRDNAALPTRFWSMPLLRLPVALGLLLAGGALVWLSSVQYLAGAYHAAGYEAFAASDFTTANSDFVHAVHLWGAPQYFADASRNSFEILTAQLASNAPVATDEATINDSVAYSNSAVAAGPNDYDAWLSRSSLFVSFVGYKVPDTEAQASTSLRRAGLLAPNRVEVPYLRAVLASEIGQSQEEQYYVTQALALKPDYAPALQLQGQPAPQQ